MPAIGFSTGALFKEALTNGVSAARQMHLDVIELSALRMRELSGLQEFVQTNDLTAFTYISLHAPTDEKRGELVPLNKKYGVADIIAAAKKFPVRKRSRITFEYVLLAGVNDSIDDARKLAKLLRGVKSKVNLIPLNAAPGIPFERPSDLAIDRFAKTLADSGLLVSVRKSRGRDIRAACGQLIVEGQKRSAAQQLAVSM